MATGVTVNDEVVSQFNDFKLHKEPHNHRFYIYKVSGHEVVIDQFGDKTKTWEDFCHALPPTECRYGLFDLEYKTPDGRDTDKLVFMAWAPDSAKVKDKMIFAGTKDAVKTALVGVGAHLQATDPSELDMETWIMPAINKI